MYATSVFGFSYIVEGFLATQMYGVAGFSVDTTATIIAACINYYWHTFVDRHKACLLLDTYEFIDIYCEKIKVKSWGDILMR